MKTRQLLKNRGFSLIELLIVVAIILVIAAIAIPNLMRARIASNESAAASQLRTLNTAEVSYTTAYPAQGYGTLAQLGGPAPCTPAIANACLIDNSLATNYGGNGKSGYNFAIAVINACQYAATAAPITVGSTGVNSFCSIEDGVVRKDPGGAVDATEAACGALAALVGEQDFAASSHDSFDANSLEMVTLRQPTRKAGDLRVHGLPTCLWGGSSGAICSDSYPQRQELSEISGSNTGVDPS